MTRPSTSCLNRDQDVDARHKAGHDDSVQPEMLWRVAYGLADITARLA